MTTASTPATSPTRPPRYAIRLAAEVTHGTAQLTATTKNLSVGGACLELDRALPEGAQLELVLYVVEDDIEAVGGSRLPVRATVQWMTEPEPPARTFHVGLKWLDATPQQVTALERAIRVVEAL